MNPLPSERRAAVVHRKGSRVEVMRSCDEWVGGVVLRNGRDKDGLYTEVEGDDGYIERHLRRDVRAPAARKHNHADCDRRCVYEHADGRVYCDYEGPPDIRLHVPESELLPHVAEVYRIEGRTIGSLVTRYQIDAPGSGEAGQAACGNLREPHQIMALYQGGIDCQGLCVVGFACSCTRQEWDVLRDELGGVDAVKAELRRRSEVGRNPSAADIRLHVPESELPALLEDKRVRAWHVRFEGDIIGDLWRTMYAVSKNATRADIEAAVRKDGNIGSTRAVDVEVY